MTENEYQALDALGLSDLLRRDEVTPGQIMEHAVNLSRTRGSAYNALCLEQYEESLMLADQYAKRGRFQGVPFLFKDSGLASKRFPMRVGSRLFKDNVAHHNCTLADRFEAEGLIPFARTTTPEFCMSPATEAKINGSPTLNPWNSSLSCGGSSGGAAVAVATRLVPMAHASDGGGSIRIPASCCGVFGLKPTRGRMPSGPDKGEIWGGLAIDGVLSRTVRDSAAVLDAISGRENYSPYGMAPLQMSCIDALQGRNPSPLRIGVWRDAWNGIPIASECQAALEKVTGLCESLGHIVIDSKLPELHYEEFFNCHRTVLASHIVNSVNTKLYARGRPLADDELEPAILDGYVTGQKLTAEDYIKAIECFHRVARVMQSSMDSFDLILTPTLNRLPAPVGYLTMEQPFYELRSKIAQYATFMAVFNASGQPAANIPIYWTDDLIPVGVQVVAQFGREDLIFKLASQLESLAPWCQRTPPYLV